MKAVLNMYGQTFEVEIKAKRAENLNVSPKATTIVTRWLESRLWEASHDNEMFPSLCDEICNCAKKLQKYNEMQPVSHIEKLKVY